MNRIAILVSITVLIIAGSCLATNEVNPQICDARPLVFSENLGQWDDVVKFGATAKDLSIWLTDQGLYFDLKEKQFKDDMSDTDVFSQDEITRIAKRKLVHFSFIGSSNKLYNGIEKKQTVFNYYRGHNPSQWKKDVPGYGGVFCHDIYPNIDLKCYGHAKAIEYDFVVNPGGDPESIIIECAGADFLKIEDNGDLTIATDLGNLTNIKPIAYQNIDGTKVPVDVQFEMISDKQYGFNIISPYSTDFPLIIDPICAFSTYLDGNTSAETSVDGIATDKFGNIYVTGSTGSTDFPTENPFQSTLQGGKDVIVTKFSPDGSSIIFSTFLGGTGDDKGMDITIDVDDRVYITGNTRSSDFPITDFVADSLFNNQDLSGGAQDAFVAKFLTDGSLVFSTYIGGSGTMAEWGSAIAVPEYVSDPQIYVVGRTRAYDFPLQNAAYSSLVGSLPDGFLTILSPTGQSFVYSTYLTGSSGFTEAMDLALDHSGNILVTGRTTSTDLPAPGGYLTYHQGGTYDAFLLEFDNAGNQIYGTYLGGSGDDEGRAVFDYYGDIYIAGNTMSTGLATPIPGAWDIVLNDGVILDKSDAFLLIMEDDGYPPTYFTYLGGSDNDYCYGMELSKHYGWILLTGYTHSTDFPTSVDAFDNTMYGGEGFVTQMTNDGRSIDYSTFLGGSTAGIESCYCITSDIENNVIVGGYTSSSDFPVHNARDASYDGAGDGFIAKFSPSSSCGDNGFYPDYNGWQIGNSEGIIWGPPVDLTTAVMWPETWYSQFDYCFTTSPCCLNITGCPIWCPDACPDKLFPDWPLFVEAFGEDQCELSAFPYILPSARNLWNGITGDWGGSCYGFAVTSLLFFDGYLDMNSTIGSYSQLYDAYPINDDLRSFINKYYIYQFGWDQILKTTYRYQYTKPNATLNSIKSDLTDGVMNDRALLLFSCSDIPGQGGGHAVVPYRCEQDPVQEELWYVYIYDNNFPGDLNRKIAFNTSGTGSWTYDGVPSYWWGDERIFLTLPMDQFLENPKIWDPEQYSKDGREYLFLYFSDPDTLRITTPEGEISKSDGMYDYTLPFGAPIIPITGSDAPPIGYCMYNDDFTLEAALVDDGVTFLPESYGTSIINNNLMFNIQQLGVSDAVYYTQRIRYFRDSSVIRIDNTNLEEDTLILDVTFKMGTEEYSFHLMDFVNDVSVSMRLMPPLGADIRNYGSVTSADIIIEIAGDSPQLFASSGFTFEANTGYRFGLDWISNDNQIIVYQDPGNTGTFSDPIYLANEYNEGCCDLPGDANNDGSMNIADASFIINKIFFGGADYDCPAEADANADGSPNIADASFIINKIFFGGSDPACGPE